MTHQSWAPCGKKKREGSACPSLRTAYVYIVQDRLRARCLWRCSIGQHLTEALRERSSKSRFLGSLNLEQPAQNSHDESDATINERLHPPSVRQRAHARKGNTRTLLEHETIGVQKTHRDDRWQRSRRGGRRSRPGHRGLLRSGGRINSSPARLACRARVPPRVLTGRQT